jgi:hypothetical protein
MTVAQRMNINFVSFVRAWKQTFCVIELQRALPWLTSLALSGRGSGRAALLSGKISSVEFWYKTAYAFDLCPALYLLGFTFQLVAGPATLFYSTSMCCLVI